MFGSSINLRLGEVIGGRLSITGSKHNFLYPFLAKVHIIPQTPKYKKDIVNNNIAHIRSTSGTIKCIYANIK
ncbi:hypothetical protein B296_00014823 [Ensete ventricosum]|uniref:Uncharacterized protein n=1 Tax=Ensete ventricosum TaxID=4639 RepID=A0A427ANQ0_ENSVE|nr:hypothetical protein B296_00014823 [Ensete ventricosum]